MGVRLERDVMVPMRDGVRLATDLWVRDGEPSSVLLVRVPYGKSRIALIYSRPTCPDLLSLLDAGYALAVQDCRGTSGSEGDFRPLENEAADGEDTIAWLRGQSWCDGRVGMFHTSYLGFAQWLAASRTPDGLMAIAPNMTSPDSYNVGYSDGGALSWGTMFRFNSTMAMATVQRAVAAGTQDFATLLELVGMVMNPDPQLEAGPGDQPVLMEHCSWWPDWMEHAPRDGFWHERAASEHFRDMTVPALQIGGWFDLFVNDAARSFTRMRSEAANDEARAGQRNRVLHGPSYPSRLVLPIINR